jgi:argininosuccinate lyase
MPFSPDYVRFVLEENFEDAKRLLLNPLMAIHEAHLTMLADTGILARADARTIRGALLRLDRPAIRQTRFDGSSEDLFCHIDGLLSSDCGAEIAGRLHTARSRNDIDMTIYRMLWRDAILGVAEATLALRRSLLAIATEHVDTIFPAHTHTQPAQPTTVAHYLMALVEELERGARRLTAAYEHTNRNPLGACAITGTGFPIDRNRTSALLGFDGPTGNTYGSIATVDYLLEAASAASIVAVGVGRFVQDMLLWCTVEVGYLRLPDGFVQPSSIMPQKRNPVALEHARSILSRAVAELGAITATVHNTPYGDIVDTEDDLQPLVASAFFNATRGVAMVAAAMAEATFDTARMRARATEAGVTVTELADTLARDHGLSFRVGHHVAARVAAARRDDPATPLAPMVESLTREIGGRAVSLSEAELTDVLAPEHFITVRRTSGGPAPDVVALAIAASLEVLAADQAAVETKRAALRAAEHARHAALAAI